MGKKIRELDMVIAASRILQAKEETFPMPWSYLEFIEFSSAAEFRKFKHISRITLLEISKVDIDDLCCRLQISEVTK